jgi:hypothetical protein
MENQEDKVTPAWQVAAAQGRKPVQNTTLQTAIDWSLRDRPSVTAVDANADRSKKGRTSDRNSLRGDARRTAEYLATRGVTPIEAMHDVARMGIVRAAKHLSRELGISREKAAAIWERCTAAILPYTAARIESLELGPNAAAGFGLGHYLAARAVSDLLASERESRPEPAPSRVRHTLDATEATELPLLSAGDTPAIHGALPPKAAD